MRQRVAKSGPTLALLLLILLSLVLGDKTKCVSNIETSEGIHITCYCQGIIFIIYNLMY